MKEGLEPLEPLEQLEPINFREAETIDFATESLLLAHRVARNCVNGLTVLDFLHTLCFHAFFPASFPIGRIFDLDDFIAQVRPVGIRNQSEPARGLLGIGIEMLMRHTARPYGQQY